MYVKSSKSAVNKTHFMFMAFMSVVCALVLSGNALAVEGLSERIEIEFSYAQGFDAVGTAAYESASLAHNIQISSPSDCYFIFVPFSPDGRITPEYPDANIAFCGPQDEDIVGRIDFPNHLKSLSIDITYFDSGIVKLEAFSEAGAKIFEMQDAARVGFDAADTDNQSVAWVRLSGNQNNAAINIDNFVLHTEGVSQAIIQNGVEPLIIESVNFEANVNPFNPGTEFWRSTIDRGAHSGALFSIESSTDGGNPANQDSILEYPLVFSSTGDYYLFVRARTRAESEAVVDSLLWISSELDESPPSGALVVTPNNMYRWHRFGPIPVSSGDLGVVKNLNLGVRSSGLSVDELVLTKNGASSEAFLTGLIETSGKTAWNEDYSELEFDWTRVRGNRRRTGHSQVVGDLATEPVVKSSLDYAHSRALVGLDLDTLSQTTITPLETEYENVPEFEFHKNWNYETPVFDLDSGGTEELFRPDVATKYGHFLPGEPNLQRVLLNSGARSAEFSIWNGGGWDTLWYMQDNKLEYVGEPMISDIDNDGRLELIVLPWYDAFIIDLETGIFDHSARFIPDAANNGRPYGWAGTIDLFEDDRAEIFVVADFLNHMEVLGWNENGELEKRWDWLVENGILNKQTIIHPGVNPTGDVISGNDMLELVVSVFNSTGDDKWHTLVLNSKTGEILHDIPDAYISRLYDINADGYEELLTTPTNGRLIMSNAGGSIISLESGNITVLHSFSEGSFVESEIQKFPDFINSQTGKNRETVFVAEFDSGRPVFATWDNLKEKVTFHRFLNNDTVQALGSVEWGGGDGLLELVGFDHANSSAADILLQARGFNSTSQLTSDFSLTKFSNYRSGISLGQVPVIGRLQQQEPPAIVIHAGLNLVRKATMQSGVLNEDWSIPGRASVVGFFETGQGVVLADVQGDDNYELLVAGGDESGVATMTASNDGSPIWSTAFEGFQSWLPNWNENGLITWHSGRFNGGRKDDVAVTLRRSTMHSDETHLLNGSDGVEKWVLRSTWKETRSSNGRLPVVKYMGTSGSMDLSMDVDLDNRDELVIAAIDGFAIVDGRDGELLKAKWGYEVYGNHLFARQAIPFQDADGIFRITSFDNNQALTTFDENLEIVWKIGSGEAGNSMAVLADVDGNGVNELVLVGDDFGTSIVAYNPDGSRKWTFPAAFSQVVSASADIDNDGRDEILFVNGNQINALEQSGDNPAIKWTWSSPNENWIGGPALGDVDDDGDLEIVVSDGRNLYVLGNNSATPAPAAPAIRLLGTQFEAGDLRISWDHAPFATGYRLLIATDVNMNDVFHDMQFSRTQSSHVQTFQTGEYWVKVEAVNPQGTSSSSVHHVLIGEVQNPLLGIFSSGFESPILE